MKIRATLKNIDLEWNEQRADFYREEFKEDDRGDLQSAEIEVVAFFDMDDNIDSVELFEVFEGRSAPLKMSEYLEHNSDLKLDDAIYEEYFKWKDDYNKVNMWGGEE